MDAELRKNSKRMPAAAEQPTPSENLSQVTWTAACIVFDCDGRRSLDTFLECLCMVDNCSFYDCCCSYVVRLFSRNRR
jgi:hypothetical protein